MQRFICYIKFTNDYLKWQENQWFQFAISILKTYPHILTISCNHSPKSCINNNSHFLSKLKILGKLPQGTILCTTEVVGLYLNIAHNEGLTSLRRFLELRDNKQISSDTLIELAKKLLKKTLLNSMKSLLDRYVEPQLERNLHLRMLFCLWLT